MATTKPVGLSWVMDWVENGQRRRKAIGKLKVMSKREAELLCKAKELELATGKRVSVTAARAHRLSVLAGRYKTWHAEQYPASTSNVKRIVDDYLLPYFKDDPALDAIDAQRVEAYLASRMTSNKPSTVIKDFNVLKAMYRKGMQWGLVSSTPLGDVKKPVDLEDRPKHFFSRDELAALFAIDSPHVHTWRLMANTGLRRGEAQHLLWSDVDGSTLKILSTAGARTKSGKWRAVPLNKAALASLAAMRLQSDPDKTTGSFVIQMMWGSSISRLFKEDMKKAKLTKGSLHSLRHTFISHAIMAGKPLRLVQVWAGHSSIAVTEKYAHVSPEFSKKSMKGFEL